ncbi:hypothetical protein [Neolewinella xylanilytica]|uniref:hypothetical protein n=1 Tax=Neolewinella xylanilytica TaxID=1514080 RepID=UPI0011AFE1E8|nr:hypothetical protein [Neolewinella xylanilytica]
MQFLHRTLLFGLTLFTTSLSSQHALPLDISSRQAGCELPIVRSDVTYQRPYTFRKLSRPKALQYTVDYREDGHRMYGDTCHAWPAEAKAAFEYAVSIWSDVLQNDQSIDIQACYSPDMPTGTLGSANPQLFYVGPFLDDIVLLPQALAENLYGREFSDEDFPDIQVIVNKNYDFYYGTDANPPASKVDFVTLAVHELGHGLGFAGSARVDDGDQTNGIECEGVAGTGCVGFYDYLGNLPPRYYATAFDLFVDRVSDGAPLFGLANPGPEIYNTLLGGSGGLFFDESNHDDFYGGTENYQLYTPSTWRQGTSYSHFSDRSQALYYALTLGSAVHDVGKAREVMYNIGWPKAMASFAAALPVDLIAFDASTDGAVVTLHWQSATERDNDYFEVQVSHGTGEFRPLGRVPGAATTKVRQEYRFTDETPVTGVNHYRLRQVDYGGRETFSYVVSVRVEVETVEIGHPFPNPNGGGELFLDYRSRESGWVSARTLTATGRQFGSFRSVIRPGDNRLAFDLSGYPAGLYTLLLEDETGSVARRFVVR